VIELARQNPGLIPATIELAALERDIAAREQLLPLLFRLQRLVRMLEDTTIALGVDMYEGARGLYKAMKITAEINGLVEVVAALGERFAAQGRRKQTPSEEPTPTSDGVTGQAS
jgi:hypothetical protein